MSNSLGSTTSTEYADYEDAVAERYAAAAGEREAALCCPVEYDRELLKVIPDEVIERDYGCGDPSPFVKPGDVVVDLGSGGGKLCFIASQLVGSEGRVIGVDCNEEMLGLARKHQPTVAERIGFDNVSFRCGMIQNLQLDLEQYVAALENEPTDGVEGVMNRRRLEKRLSAEQPMIPSDSVDCVVSNCVLNLVQPQDRTQLFQEVFRVLKNGGCAAISDIVSDESVPRHLQDDSNLWSGCISGAWREDDFLAEFERAGFHGVKIARRQEEPWQTVDGIEFRSITVLAYKGKAGPCLERNQAMIYRGPFKVVEDDDGHVFRRGERIAVCDKTYRLLQSDPYGDAFYAISPRVEVPLDDAEEFNCRRSVRRHPRESKGMDYDATIENNCDTDGNCC